MNPNCPTYKQKLEELKNLHNQFQEELEVFKTTRKSEGIWETRKKVDETIEYFEGKLFLIKPFSAKELLDYERDYLGSIILDKNITWEEIERFSQTPDINIVLTEISQKYKNRIGEWKGSIIDYATKLNYIKLETVGGVLFAGNATILKAPNLKEIEVIILNDKVINLKNIDLPEEIKNKIHWVDN